MSPEEDMSQDWQDQVEADTRDENPNDSEDEYRSDFEEGDIQRTKDSDKFFISKC